MARQYDVVQVDVFTERVLRGNPLAVFLDGRGLDDGEMQALAREMNLSETTFVLPATRADCAARVRIFTPVSDRTGVATALGLDAAALHASAPIRVGSTGSPFLYVPLRDRAAVDRAALDVAAMRRAAGEPLPGVFVFCAEAAGAYSRMFAPHTSRTAEDR